SQGEIVIRKLSVSLLMLLAMLLAMNLVCQAASQTLLTRHVREAVLNGEAKLVGQLPANQTMHFDVVLALRHQPELENFLQELYDPTSPSYKQYVTPQQFAERFGASQEDYDALIAFANANGFKVIGGSLESRDVQFSAPVANVNRAFNITMAVYQHPTESRTFFSPDREPSANLPMQLWHISGLDNYSIPHPALKHRDLKVNPEVSQAQTGSCPQASFCGSDMRGAYYEGTALTGSGQNLGLLELAGTDVADLKTYYQGAKQTEPYVPTILSTGGYSTTCLASSGCDDTEQTLDMTQAMGMAPGSTMLYMYVCGDAYGTGTFSETDCLSAMVTDKAAPLSLQISCSWGWTPADPGTDDPYYEQMASQGQSFFVAAGDSDKWTENNFPFPAEDANIISVGGTDLTTTGAGGDWASEIGWADTGGGISPDEIPIPTWQQLSGVITSKNEGSTKYRNGPDVTANANFSFYVCADQTGLSGCTANEYGGTSFAAPMWAGYIALANEQAAASGKPSVGDINPAIYPLGLSGGYSAAFHDITTGNNGFPAEVGYDLDSGWGSPNGSGLINALVGSGGGGPAVSLSPTSLKWGKKAVGTTSAAKKVVLTNTGTATLNITTITTSGDFALATVKATKKVTPCVNGGTVAAGATCEIKVTFTPTQTGTRTGDVTFTDNANPTTQQVSLSGTGK
ncbi:MAG: protease pro-enzyme activation domain-containing protein, partial [Terriglobales bacterium]